MQETSDGAEPLVVGSWTGRGGGLEVLEDSSRRALLADHREVILWASPGFCVSRGLVVADVVGRRCSDVLHGADRPCPDDGRCCPSRLARELGCPVRVEHEHLRPEGGLYSEEACHRPIANGTSAFRHVLVSLRDVSARRRLSSGPLAATPGIREMVEGGPRGALVVDPGFVIEEADTLALELLSGASGRRPSSFLEPLDPRSKRAIERFLAAAPVEERSLYWIELVATSGDGAPRPFEAALASPPPDDGRVTLLLRPPPEEHTVEAEIATLCHVLATIAATPEAAVLVVDPAGVVKMASGAVERLLGHRSDEIVRKLGLDALHPSPVAAELLDAVGAATRRCGIRQVAPRRFFVRLTGGRRAKVLVDGLRGTNAQGAEGALLVYSDPKRPAIAMGTLDTEVKFRRLFESVQQGVFFSTSGGRFIDFNPALQQMLGYGTRDELLSIDIPTDLYSDRADRLTLQREVELRGTVKNLELRFKKKGGEEITVELTAHPLTDRVGKVVGYQGLVNDVTEQRRLQDQLVQAEKLATLGTLAAGVAHELNNPLGGILAFGHLLLEQTEAGDPRRRHVERIVRESTRCARIIEQLLQFSRRSSHAHRPTDANAAVDSAMALLECQAFFEGVVVVRDLAADLPAVRADPGQLEQVLCNVIRNAAEAIEGTGTITVSTKLGDDGAAVDITVRDDGPGMAEHVRRRVFEPFFSTKAPSLSGSGAGLGLAISESIVASHGGTVDVASEPGRGTTCTVTLQVDRGHR